MSLDGSYHHYHTLPMATVRRTITLPQFLAREIEAEAKKRGLSFSAVLAERAVAKRRLSFTGLIHDDPDPDLSLHVEEILARHFRD